MGGLALDKRSKGRRGRKVTVLTRYRDSAEVNEARGVDSLLRGSAAASKQPLRRLRSTSMRGALSR